MASEEAAGPPQGHLVEAVHGSSGSASPALARVWRLASRGKVRQDTKKAGKRPLGEKKDKIFQVMLSLRVRDRHELCF